MEAPETELDVQRNTLCFKSIFCCLPIMRVTHGFFIRKHVLHYGPRGKVVKALFKSVSIQLKRTNTTITEFGL